MLYPTTPATCQCPITEEDLESESDSALSTNSMDEVPLATKRLVWNWNAKQKAASIGEFYCKFVRF